MEYEKMENKELLEILKSTVRTVVTCNELITRENEKLMNLENVELYYVTVSGIYEGMFEILMTTLKLSEEKEENWIELKK